jgi:hypothetical protein
MEPEDRRQHLSFLQTVIARQAGNQFLIKGWSLTVAAAMYAYAASKSLPAVACVGAAVSLVFAALDTYYLRQERLFRRLWCAVLEGSDGDLAGYDLDTSPYGSPLSWPWHLPAGDTRRRLVALSPPVVLLYGTQVLFGVVLALVA